MTEKTDELRDIFVSVTDEEAVTESQAETRGSLATDEEGVDERLIAVIDRIRERFPFRSDLADGDLATVVRAYFEGESDAAIADRLGVAESAVREARLDCHLVRDGDVPESVDLGDLRTRIDDPTETEMPSDGALGAALDADPEAVARARRVLATRARSRSVSQRFRSEFEDALADAGLSSRMTESVREDGLSEATDDMDSLESDADVGF